MRKFAKLSISRKFPPKLKRGQCWQRQSLYKYTYFCVGVIIPSSSHHIYTAEIDNSSSLIESTT